MVFSMTTAMVLLNMLLFFDFQTKLYALSMLIWFVSMLVSAVLECSEKMRTKRISLFLLLALNGSVAVTALQEWQRFGTTGYLYTGFQFGMLALLALVACGGALRKEKGQ